MYKGVSGDTDYFFQLCRVNMYAKKKTVTMFGMDVEVYQLPNGEYTMSKTQVGQVIEKGDKSLRQFLDGTSPEAAPYKGVTLEVLTIAETQLTIQVVPWDIIYAYWTYWAKKSNVLAQTLIENISKLTYQDGVNMFGENFKQHVIYTKVNKVKPSTPEKDIQLKLHEVLSGLCEVVTPVGKIDILTDNLLIEIKKAKDWKTAVGQLLMYGNYYPKHIKVMYLFDLQKSCDITLIEKLCEIHNILVCTTVNRLVNISFNRRPVQSQLSSTTVTPYTF